MLSFLKSKPAYYEMNVKFLVVVKVFKLKRCTAVDKYMHGKSLNKIMLTFIPQ